MRYLDALELVTRHTAGQLTTHQQVRLTKALTRIPMSASDFEIACGLATPTFSADPESTDHD